MCTHVNQAVLAAVGLGRPWSARRVRSGCFHHVHSEQLARDWLAAARRHAQSVRFAMSSVSAGCIRRKPASSARGQRRCCVGPRRRVCDRASERERRAAPHTHARRAHTTRNRDNVACSPRPSEALASYLRANSAGKLQCMASGASVALVSFVYVATPAERDEREACTSASSESIELHGARSRPNRRASNSFTTDRALVHHALPPRQVSGGNWYTQR